ncbi:MAG: hypothetical protein DRN71_03905 [Candidatus Nanohalarchaeota archaeon]|nr:MAG: hypothetical protein DRN71_03905 [Candidatus Nanohaloarchaeota archaeon]
MSEFISRGYVLAWVLVLLVVVPVASATGGVYDIEVLINAPDNFTLDKSNSYKVIIKSNETVSPGVNVTVVREIFNESVRVYRKEGNYSFKSHVTKKFQWTPKVPGNYTICANVTYVSVNDSDAANNWMCQKIVVLNVTAGDDDEGNVTFGNFSCDLSVRVSTKKFFYNSSESLGIKVVIEDVNHSGIEHGFILAYWIEDLFGNVVKARYEKSYIMNLSETRSYNPKAMDISDSEAYVVKAEIVDAGCNDSNAGNDFNESMILVKGALVEGDGGARGESIIEITKVSPVKTTFGDIISVSVDVYRGDTSKYSLSVWAERPSDGFDVSEKSTVHLKNKYTEYSLKVPVVVKSNCNERYKDGNYELIVEGLGVRETKRIVLSGLSSALCKTETVTKWKWKVKKETKKDEENVDSGAEKAEKVPDFVVEFVSWEENVSFGDEFVTGVEMRNNKGVAVNVSVYSYVIDGRARMSEGLAEDGVWKKSWTGNKRGIVIGAGDLVVVNLTNRMQRYVTGNYTLKVKVKVKGDVERVIDRGIYVFEPEVVDDFFRVWCNATDRKTYLFLENGGTHEKEVVVLSPGRAGVRRRVVVDGGEWKQIAYFGRVDVFVVECGDEEFVCRPEHEDYDEELEARGDEVVMMGSGGKMSFVDWVIEKLWLFFGRR